MLVLSFSRGGTGGVGQVELVVPADQHAARARTKGCRRSIVGSPLQRPQRPASPVEFALQPVAFGAEHPGDRGRVAGEDLRDGGQRHLEGAQQRGHQGRGRLFRSVAVAAGGVDPPGAAGPARRGGAAACRSPGHRAPSHKGTVQRPGESPRAGPAPPQDAGRRWCRQARQLASFRGAGGCRRGPPYNEPSGTRSSPDGHERASHRWLSRPGSTRPWPTSPSRMPCWPPSCAFRGRGRDSCLASGMLDLLAQGTVVAWPCRRATAAWPRASRRLYERRLRRLGRERPAGREAGQRPRAVTPSRSLSSTGDHTHRVTQCLREPGGESIVPGCHGIGLTTIRYRIAATGNMVTTPATVVRLAARW